MLSRFSVVIHPKYIHQSQPSGEKLFDFQSECAYAVRQHILLSAHASLLSNQMQYPVLVRICSFVEHSPQCARISLIQSDAISGFSAHMQFRRTLSLVRTHLPFRITSQWSNEIIVHTVTQIQRVLNVLVANSCQPIKSTENIVEWYNTMYITLITTPTPIYRKLLLCMKSDTVKHIYIFRAHA